jgi:hypothetical protein
MPLLPLPVEPDEADSFSLLYCAMEIGMVDMNIGVTSCKETRHRSKGSFHTEHQVSAVIP